MAAVTLLDQYRANPALEEFVAPFVRSLEVGDSHACDQQAQQEAERDRQTRGSDDPMTWFGGCRFHGNVVPDREITASRVKPVTDPGTFRLKVEATPRARHVLLRVTSPRPLRQAPQAVAEGLVGEGALVAGLELRASGDGVRGRGHPSR